MSKRSRNRMKPDNRELPAQMFKLLELLGAPALRPLGATSEITVCLQCEGEGVGKSGKPCRGCKGEGVVGLPFGTYNPELTLEELFRN
jgi:hypothetical protein